MDPTPALGYAAAFTAGFLFAASDVLVRIASKGVTPRGMLAISLLAGTPFMLATALTLEKGFPAGDEVLLYAAAGLLNFIIGRLLFYYAIAGAGATTASVTTTPTIIIAALLAWPVLGERLEANTLAGLLLVTGGIYLASKKPSGASMQGVNPRLGVLAGVASSFVFATTTLLVRAAGSSGGHPLWGATISYATALPIALALSRRDLAQVFAHARRLRRELAAGVAGAIVVAGAQLSRYTALSILPVAYAVLLISLFPLHTALLARLSGTAVGEEVGLRHLAGGLLAFTGIAVAVL